MQFLISNYLRPDELISNKNQTKKLFFFFNKTDNRDVRVLCFIILENIEFLPFLSIVIHN